MDQEVGTVIMPMSGRQVASKVDEGRVEGYWAAVSQTMRRVFDDDDPGSSIDKARERLSRAGDETRSLFYHATPLQVASDLLGHPHGDLTVDQLRTYVEIIDELDPSTAISGEKLESRPQNL